MAGLKRRYPRILPVSLAVALLFGAAWLRAEAQKDKERDLKITPKKPVEIRSNELVYDRESGLTLFKGDVRVMHGGTDLRASEVRATSGNREATAETDVTVVDKEMAATLSCGHLDYKDQMRYISAHEEPKLTTVDKEDRPVTLDSRQMEFYSDQQMALANQDVRMTHGDGKAVAGRATYLKSEGKVILEGEPRAFNDFGEVTGRRLTAFLDEKRLVAEGDVAAVFFPTPPPGGGKGSVSAVGRPAGHSPGASGGSRNAAKPTPSPTAMPTALPAAPAETSTPTPTPTPTRAPERPNDSKWKVLR